MGTCRARRLPGILRVEQVTTIVALITASLLVAADGTGALDIAVGQETSLALRVKLVLDFAVDILLLVKPEEEILGDAVVVLRVRVCEQVIADPDRLLGL